MKKTIILATLYLFTKIQGIHLIEQTKDDSLIFDKNVCITGQLSPQFYAQVVAQLPIVCVDVFVLNEVKNEYFLVYRKNKPAQNSFCLPGGRLYKGETFFECAHRKCFEEAGLKIDSKRIIYTYSAIFPDSAWDCPTHTVSIVNTLGAGDAFGSALTAALWQDMPIEQAINLALLNSKYVIETEGATNGLVSLQAMLYEIKQ